MLLAICLLLPGCGKSPAAPATSGDADISGVYTLVTVDGKPLPARVTHDGAALEVRSGSFVIHADGTCSSKVTFVPPSGAEAIREVSATYSREGMKLNMQWKGAGKTVGTVSSNTFTMDNEGMAFSYKK